MAKLDWSKCKKEYVSKVYTPLEHKEKQKIMKHVYDTMSNYYWHLPPYVGTPTKELPLDYLASLGAKLPLDSADLELVTDELTRRVIKQRRSK